MKISKLVETLPMMIGETIIGADFDRSIEDLNKIKGYMWSNGNSMFTSFKISRVEFTLEMDNEQYINTCSIKGLNKFLDMKDTPLSKKDIKNTEKLFGCKMSYNKKKDIYTLSSTKVAKIKGNLEKTMAKMSLRVIQEFVELAKVGKMYEFSINFSYDEEFELKGIKMVLPKPFMKCPTMKVLLSILPALQGYTDPVASVKIKDNKIIFKSHPIVEEEEKSDKSIIEELNDLSEKRDEAMESFIKNCERYSDIAGGAALSDLLDSISNSVDKCENVINVSDIDNGDLLDKKMSDMSSEEIDEYCNILLNSEPKSNEDILKENKEELEELLK